MNVRVRPNFIEGAGRKALQRSEITNIHEHSHVDRLTSLGRGAEAQVLVFSVLRSAFLLQAAENYISGQKGDPRELIQDNPTIGSEVGGSRMYERTIR